MTYWAINAYFLATAAIVAVIATVLVARGRRTGISWRWTLLALVIVLAMTAVFDNVMIGVGLVAYDPARISGAFIGVAPLEDFAYAVAAVVLLPAVWIVLGERMPRRSHPGARSGTHDVAHSATRELGGGSHGTAASGQHAPPATSAHTDPARVASADPAAPDVAGEEPRS